MNLNDIVDYLSYFWPFHKHKFGIFAALVLVIFLWLTYVVPYYKTDERLFWIYSVIALIVAITILISWLFYSGRVLSPKKGYTVVFCLRAQDAKSNKYIKNTMSLFTTELDRLGLLQKFQIKAIGTDLIANQKDARLYREKHDVDLVIWGEVFPGAKENKEVYDFKKLFFTYKIPGRIASANLIPLFAADINIAVVDRDWNIYEINNIPDTEKISEHLFEIILFIVGLIYSQHLEFAESSTLIFENLLKHLEARTTGQQITINTTSNSLQISPPLLRKSRILTILVSLYKWLGLHFVECSNYRKGNYYLEKVIPFGRNDIAVFSSLALCVFYLKDVDAAKKYTEEIDKAEKNHEIYLLNRAFFGIWERNYGSALHFYKKTVSQGKRVSGDIITKVIAFLDERKSQQQNELAYDFAIGMLNYYFCHRKSGLKELRKFMKQARKKSEYREMVSYVENNVLAKDKRKKERIRG